MEHLALKAEIKTEQIEFTNEMHFAYIREETKLVLFQFHGPTIWIESLQPWQFCSSSNRMYNFLNSPNFCLKKNAYAALTGLEECVHA